MATAELPHQVGRPGPGAESIAPMQLAAQQQRSQGESKKRQFSEVEKEISSTLEGGGMVNMILQVILQKSPPMTSQTLFQKFYSVARIVDSRLRRSAPTPQAYMDLSTLDLRVRTVVAQIHRGASLTRQRKKQAPPPKKRTPTHETGAPERKRLKSCIIDVDEQLGRRCPVSLHPCAEMHNIKKFLPAGCSQRELLRFSASTLALDGDDAANEVLPTLSRGLGEIISRAMEPGRVLQPLSTVQSSTQASQQKRAKPLAGREQSATTSAGSAKTMQQQIKPAQSTLHRQQQTPDAQSLIARGMEQRMLESFQTVQALNRAQGPPEERHAALMNLLNNKQAANRAVMTAMLGGSVVGQKSLGGAATVPSFPSAGPPAASGGQLGTAVSEVLPGKEDLTSYLLGASALQMQPPLLQIHPQMRNFASRFA